MVSGRSCRSLPLSLVLVPALFLPGCQESQHLPAPEIVRTDSAGVEIVMARGDAALSWHFEPLFALGGDDEGPAGFYRVDASMVGADLEGRLYVLTGSRVEVFAPDGDHLRSLGREGEGPGEISMGNALAVSPEGEVAVFDGGKRALVRFGPEGEVLPQMRLDSWPVQDGSRRLGVLRGSLLMNRSRTLAESGEMEVRLLELDLAEEDGSRMRSRVVRPAGVMVGFERCGGGLRRPPILSPELIWDARADRLAWSDGPEYRIEVMGPGDERLSVRRDLPTRPGSRDLALAEVGEGLTMRFGAWAEPCHITPEEMVEGWGHAEEVPWVRWVAVDPRGRLWITRREVREGDLSERVDVFSPEGEYLGTLPPGTPAPLLALPGDRVAWVEEDALEIERLVVARIVSGPRSQE